MKKVDKGLEDDKTWNLATEFMKDSGKAVPIRRASSKPKSSRCIQAASF